MRPCLSSKAVSRSWPPSWPASLYVISFRCSRTPSFVVHGPLHCCLLLLCLLWACVCLLYRSCGVDSTGAKNSGNMSKLATNEKRRYLTSLTPRAQLFDASSVQQELRQIRSTAPSPALIDEETCGRGGPHERRATVSSSTHYPCGERAADVHTQRFLAARGGTADTCCMGCLSLRNPPAAVGGRTWCRRPRKRAERRDQWYVDRRRASQSIPPCSPLFYRLPLCGQGHAHWVTVQVYHGVPENHTPLATSQPSNEASALRRAPARRIASMAMAAIEAVYPNPNNLIR